MEKYQIIDMTTLHHKFIFDICFRSSIYKVLLVAKRRKVMEAIMEGGKIYVGKTLYYRKASNSHVLADGSKLKSNT